MAWLLPGLASAANPSPDPTAYTAALRGTTVGGNAAQAYFLVPLLRRADAPPAEVEALRRELLHAYLAQMTAPAAPPPPPPSAWQSFKRGLPGMARPPADTVAAAIARGQSRPSVLETPFRAAWQAALNQGLAPRWETGAARAPFFTLELRDMQAVAPGVWAAPGADGRVRLMLSLRLANTSAQPLPIHRPDLVFDSPQGQLVFACNWDRARKNESQMKANEVTLLPPGAESEPLACEAPPAAAWWREQLPPLVAASGRPGAPALLVPHDMDTRQRLTHLELALAELAPQAVDWSKRLLLARQEPGRQWAPAEQALLPPESRRWAATPHQSWAAAGERLKLFLGATVLALGLFAAGRGMLRAGLPKGAVSIGTALAGGALWLGASATLGAGGTGYGHPLYVGLGLWSVYFGPMLLGVLALHGLHKLLDAEQLDWWETVATGWRRALHLGGETTRAEFWGFLAHCAWIWALARICLVPLDRWIGLVLLVPLLTVTVRRLRSMTGREVLEVGLSLACLVLLALF